MIHSSLLPLINPRRFFHLRLALSRWPVLLAEAMSLAELIRYFLYLGTFGFGGPVALVGFMHRDLVDKQKRISEDTYKLSLALAQIMPGPLAAQTAIAIGYFEGGIAGATLGGIAFVLPSFLMVVGISLVYVAYGGLWWMQALFYAIGATVIAIIAISAYKLARGTNKKDPLAVGHFCRAHDCNVMGASRVGGIFHSCGHRGSGDARLAGSHARDDHYRRRSGFGPGNFRHRSLAAPIRRRGRIGPCADSDTFVLH